MRLLILGGTGFLGYHTTRSALDAGHEVSLFNRGKSRPDEFGEVERLIGDRVAGDIAALEAVDGLDAVIDCTGYLPSQVKASAQLLRARSRRYLFVSTISVYDMGSAEVPITEDAPLAQMPDGVDESKVSPETYGPLKVRCEQEARDAFGNDAVIVRPGLIVGPHDPTDRFTYWVRRGRDGGKILAPGSPQDRVQVIDGRDLGAWMVDLALGEISGVFNGVAPPETFGTMLEACVVAPDAEVRWIPSEVLIEAGVEPWQDLPLWVGDAELFVSDARASAAGLVTRPLRETIADTREWDEQRGLPELKAGISREREAELLS
ncbi:MAG: NAD-dependent epimerase/dehydratase family protein [Actinomycetota bacterium]